MGGYHPPQLVNNPYFFKGTPSLARRSLLKNSPLDCFLIHPLRSALRLFVGLCPTPHQRRCLWTLPKEHSPFGIPFIGIRTFSTNWGRTMCARFFMSIFTNGVVVLLFAGEHCSSLQGVHDNYIYFYASVRNAINVFVQS